MREFEQDMAENRRRRPKRNVSRLQNELGVWNNYRKELNNIMIGEMLESPLRSQYGDVLSLSSPDISYAGYRIKRKYGAFSVTLSDEGFYRFGIPRASLMATSHRLSD